MVNMTLSLTLATPHYVLQVTDRLVSYARSGKPFDFVSNKNVVYQARDAILTIAYSGPAFVKDRPTDQWIAEVLTGQRYFDDGESWTLRSGDVGQWLDVGTCVSRLRESVKKARVGSRETHFSLIVAGWQWKKERLRARPILSVLEYDGKTVNEERAPAPRYWHLARWPRSRQPIYPCTTHVFLAPHMITGIPDGNVTDEFIVRTARRLQGCLNSPSATLDELVKCVRERGLEAKGVGEDCLGIFLPHPRNPRVEVVYRSARDHELLKFDGAVAAPDYSPWIVGRANVQAPSLVMGNAPILQLDDFAVHQSGRPIQPRANVGGRHWLAFQTHQRRRPAPKAR